MLSLAGGDWLCWGVGSTFQGDRLLVSELANAQLAVAETAFAGLYLPNEYAGARGARRRWLSWSHYRPQPETTREIHTAFSDTAQVWHEVQRLGVDEDHCSIAPLADSSALLAYAGQLGLSWARLQDTTWVEQGNLDSRGFTPAHPRFRFRPSGGLWLAWTDRRTTHVSSYLNGVWDRGDSIVCVHGPGVTRAPGWLDVSRDGAERPIVVWGDLGFGSTFTDVGCISFPTDSGWSAGEEIPGSLGMTYTPNVTRDRNGDAWCVWNLGYTGRAFFTHTYCGATSSPPTFEGSKKIPSLRWALSARAPESWWAVMRSNDGGPFDSIARVQAGQDTIVAYSDSSAPSNAVLRYRIRRESVDKRYEWLSEEATWWPRTQQLDLWLSGANPAQSQIEFVLTGGEAGTLDVRLFDLQGREVLRVRPVANGSGSDRVRLDLAGSGSAIRSGIYFLKAVDAAGSVSNTAKIAVIR